VQFILQPTIKIGSKTKVRFLQNKNNLILTLNLNKFDFWENYFRRTTYKRR